jgi:hypothetical protein
MAPPCEKPASKMRWPVGIAAGDLALDQPVDECDRLAHAGSSSALGDLQAEDVVPGAHAHAAVDRHRAHRRVREHEAHRRPVRSPARARSARSRAVGAQAVQPDAGGLFIGAVAGVEGSARDRSRVH